MLVPECRRDHNVGQRLAHHLVATVAEGALRGPIELSDAALVIDRHNAVECRVEDRGFARLAALQLNFLLA